MVIDTIADAKIYSFNKWDSILNILNRIDDLKGNICGFCLYADTLKEESNISNVSRCSYCLVQTDCDRLVNEYSHIFYDLIHKNKEIIKFIKNVKEES